MWLHPTERLYPRRYNGRQCGCGCHAVAHNLHGQSHRQAVRAELLVRIAGAWVARAAGTQVHVVVVRWPGAMPHHINIDIHLGHLHHASVYTAACLWLRVYRHVQDTALHMAFAVRQRYEVQFHTNSVSQCVRVTSLEHGDSGIGKRHLWHTCKQRWPIPAVGSRTRTARLGCTTCRRTSQYANRGLGSRGGGMQRRNT